MKSQKSASFPKVFSSDYEELPEGWLLSTIGECFSDIKNGTSVQQNKDKMGIPVSRIETIQKAKFDLNRIQHIENPTHELIKNYQYQIGDIAFSHINSLEHVGKTALYDGNPEVFLHGMNLLRLRIGRPDIFPKFAYYFMQTNFFRDEVRSRVGKAVNQVSINQKNLVTVPFLIAPLSEQQRIVARVEALLTHVNAARDRMRRVPLVMKKFRQATLAAACSGRLTDGWRAENPGVDPANALISKILDERKLWYDSEFNKAKLDGRKKPRKAKFLRKETTSEDLILDLPFSWEICFFEDIAANSENAIKAGPFGSSLTKSCYTKSGYKIYGQEQVIKGDSTYGDYWISEEKYRELESCKVRPDDILISLVGTMGKVLILPKDCKAGIINPRLVKLSIDPKISKQYVKNYLESPIAKNRLFGDSHGGTMEILNLEILKNLPIPLPPLAEQHEIVRRVGLLFERADAFDQEVVAASRRCERLTQAVLGKAFRGEFVENKENMSCVK